MALTRLELKKLPSGSYSFVDYMDNDGVGLDKRIKIQVTLTIGRADFMADFTGTSSQVRGPFNVTPAGSLAAAAFVIRAFAGASIPTNAGCFRMIKLTIPEGTVLNPCHPAPVGARQVTIDRVCDVLMGALAKASLE